MLNAPKRGKTTKWVEKRKRREQTGKKLPGRLKLMAKT